MFNLNSAVFAATTEYSYETVGTLASNCKGRRLNFTKNNLAKVAKEDGKYNRVAIIATNVTDDKDVKIVPCSEPLSIIIRKALATKSQKEVLIALTKLSIQADKTDASKYFLMQPAATSTESFLVEELAAEEVTFESLMASAL